MPLEEVLETVLLKEAVSWEKEREEALPAVAQGDMVKEANQGFLEDLLPVADGTLTESF